MLTWARLMMEPSLFSKRLSTSRSALSRLCFSIVWKWAHSAASFLLSSAQCCITDFCSSSKAFWGNTRDVQTWEPSHTTGISVADYQPHLCSFQLLSLNADLHAEGTPLLLQASLSGLRFGLLSSHLPAFLKVYGDGVFSVCGKQKQNCTTRTSAVLPLSQSSLISQWPSQAVSAARWAESPSWKWFPWGKLSPLLWLFAAGPDGPASLKCYSMTLTHLQRDSQPKHAVGQVVCWPIWTKCVHVCVCERYFGAARLCAVSPAPGHEPCVHECSPPEKRVLRGGRRTAPSARWPL